MPPTHSNCRATPLLVWDTTTMHLVHCSKLVPDFLHCPLHGVSPSLHCLFDVTILRLWGFLEINKEQFKMSSFQVMLMMLAVLGSLLLRRNRLITNMCPCILRII